MDQAGLQRELDQIGQIDGSFCLINGRVTIGMLTDRDQQPRYPRDRTEPWPFFPKDVPWPRH